jgi:hypothetical protein
VKKSYDQSAEIATLRRELQQVRQQSLAASRKGDFRTIARLTCEASRLNRAILAAEGMRVVALDEISNVLVPVFSRPAQFRPQEESESQQAEPALVA